MFVAESELLQNWNRECDPRQGRYPSGYPIYEISTVNGVIETIEHRQLEPIFYIVDNPAVLAELGVKQ